VVATAVKDVYRDILSGNDKALANNQQKQGSPERVYNYNFGDEGDSEQTMPRWKGMLSIGVDELSNTLIVSAPRFLFDQVDALIKELDERAKPTSSVRVVRLDGKVNTAVVRQALANILGQPQAAAPPNGDKGRQQGQPPPDQAQPAVQP
jgi:type II secretory pathway component GspD/PulD (secretin)